MEVPEEFDVLGVAGEPKVEIKSESEDLEYDSDVEMTEMAQVLENEAEEDRDPLNLPLPEKSKQKYIKSYELFLNWRMERNITSTDEKVLLRYFKELSEEKSWKPPTLWSHWSMLRPMLTSQESIDIKTYTKLKSFMKKRSAGYRPKKTQYFTSENVRRFCNEAPDDPHLVTKVALIFGFLGGMRRIELVSTTVRHVREEGSIILVEIPGFNKQDSRSFTVMGKNVEIVKKYRSLRPQNCESKRFFLNYQKGKCTPQPIGINKFGAMPRKIAEFLNLPNPELFTGHAFRSGMSTRDINSPIFDESPVKPKEPEKPRIITYQRPVLIRTDKPDMIKTDKPNLVTTDESGVAEIIVDSGNPSVYHFHNCTINFIRKEKD